MSLWSRLRQWLGLGLGLGLGRRRPSEVRREATRLARTDDAAGQARFEIVDLRGGPLREHHRRLALRDGRLLPKPATLATRLRRAVRDGLRLERPPILGTDEAARLFGGTMRTRNRELRDLLPDEEQLRRLGLPVWRTEADVAAALGLELRQWRRFTIHRERERSPHYVTFAIEKRRGGERLIHAPKRQLKALLRRLDVLLVSQLPVSDAAHGFRRGRSTVTGARAHVGKRLLVRLDLRDFFPSVTFARVRGLLVAYGYGCPVATALAVILTEAERQPVVVDGATFHVPVGPRHCVQGAPTSPGICNAIVLRLDRRMLGLARRFGADYTRYADDLTFSGELDRAAASRLLHHARAIVRTEGFATNEAKTRVMTAAGRQSVTGVVVNRELGMSRSERRRLRAALHRLARDEAAGADVAAERRRLDGRLAYLHMLNPAQAARLRGPAR